MIPILSSFSKNRHSFPFFSLEVSSAFNRSDQDLSIQVQFRMDQSVSYRTQMNIMSKISTSHSGRAYNLSRRKLNCFISNALRTTILTKLDRKNSVSLGGRFYVLTSPLLFVVISSPVMSSKCLLLFKMIEKHYNWMKSHEIHF